MKAQQAQAVPASPRPRSLAPFDFPSPPLSSTAAERRGAELAGALEVLGAEAFASQLSKAAARDSRPPESAAADLDPSAALLLRVEPAQPSDLRLTAPSRRIAGREGMGVDNGINGTTGTKGIPGPASAPLSAAEPAPDLRLRTSSSTPPEEGKT